MKKGISVIVCCYNAELRLPKTLEYLANQKINSDVSVEIIIVNNASTDKTVDVATSEWRKYNSNFSFNIIDEFIQGLIYARCKGVESAEYEYVVFCDDDNWLQSDYLQNAFSLMESNPQIGALGGQGIAVSDVELPDWFTDYENGYATGKQAAFSGDVSKRGYLWGAGLVARLSLLYKVFDKKYPFLLVGREGGLLLAGDDAEICKRILLLNYSLYYDQSLLFYHYIPSNRLSWENRKKMFQGFDISDVILRKYEIIYLETCKRKINQFLEIISAFLKKMIYFIFFNKKHDKITPVLRAKVGLFFKNEALVNDADYKLILKYTFMNSFKTAQSFKQEK